MEQGWGRGRGQSSPVQWNECCWQRCLCQKGDATCKQLENKLRGRLGQNEDGEIDDGHIRRCEPRIFTFTLRAVGFYSYSRQAWASFKHTLVDFPGGPVVENPPSNAGDMNLISGWGTKIPHAVGQLSLCTTTREDSGQPKQKKSRCQNHTLPGG